MSDKFVLTEDRSDSSDTELTPSLSRSKHAINNVESPYIPMEELHHYEADSVNLEVGEKCTARYKRKEDKPKLNSLSLFERDIRMRPKVSD